MIKVNAEYFRYLQRCEKDLGFFFTDLVWPTCTDDPFRKSPYAFDLLIEYAVAWINGEIPNLIICLPPRNGKSKLFSVAVPLWLWIKHSGTRIINTSSTDEVLEDFKLDRNRVITNPDYKKLCPAKIVKDEKGRVENEKGGYVVSWTILNTRIGLGGDYIIVDDPIATKNKDNKAHCKKVYTEFSNGLMSRRNRKNINNPSPVLITMQRLSEFDLAGEMKERGFHYVGLQAYAETPQSFIFPLSGKTWERPVLDVLNPELEDLETLYSLRTTTENFQAQFQQKPLSSKGAFLNTTDLCLYKELSEYRDIIITIDTAGSIEDDSCNWAISIIGETDIGEETYSDLLFSYALQHQYPSGKLKVIELIDSWEADVVLIENKSTGVALIPDLKLFYADSKKKIISIDPKGNKQDRTLRALPHIISGKLRFPDLRYFPHCVWMALVTYELIGFPNAKTDDILDTLTQYLNWAITGKVTLKQFYSSLKQVS